MARERKLTSSTKFSIAGGNQNGELDEIDFAIKAFQAGDFERAQASAKRVLKKQPDNAEAMSLLGALAEQRGDLDGAGQHYLAAVKADPGHFKSWYSLGVLAFNRQRPVDAIAALSKALVIDPGFADGKWVLARALVLAGRPDEAARLYDELLAGQPGNAHMLSNYADCLIGLDRVGEAEKVVRKALEIVPDSPLVKRQLARCLGFCGKFDEAEDLLRSAIAAGGPKGLCYYDLGAFAMLDDEDVAEIQVLEQSKDNDQQGQIAVEVALGREFERRGDHEAGFSHYQRAARLRGQSLSYDGDDYRKKLQQLLAMADEKVFDGDEGHPSDKPVFFVGLPRSGVLFAEQVFAAHSEVFSGGEKDFSVAVAGNSGGAPGNFRDAGMAYLSSFPVEALDHERITNRLPGNWGYSAMIMRTFARAGLVFVTRHPLDVFVSNLSVMPYRAGDYLASMDSLAHYIKDSMAAMRDLAGRLPVAPFEVMYEDLVANFEDRAAALLAYGGLDMEPQVLRFFARQRCVRSSSPLEIRQPVSDASVGRWRGFGDMLAPAREIMNDEIEIYEQRLASAGLAT